MEGEMYEGMCGFGRGLGYNWVFEDVKLEMGKWSLERNCGFKDEGIKGMDCVDLDVMRDLIFVCMEVLIANCFQFFIYI